MLSNGFSYGTVLEDDGCGEFVEGHFLDEYFVVGEVVCLEDVDAFLYLFCDDLDLVLRAPAGDGVFVDAAYG